MITVAESIKLIKGNNIILTSLDGVNTYELGSITTPNYGKVDTKGNYIPRDVLSQKVLNIYVQEHSRVYIEYGREKPRNSIVGSAYCADLFEGVA